MKTQIISIEGNIGSGKSTLVEKLKNSLPTDKYVFVREPVDIWLSIKDNNGISILEKFYENQEKYAFSFQMMTYISRLHLLKETIKLNPNKIIVMERCCLTDKNVFAKMLHDEGKIEDVNYKIYTMWFNEFLGDVEYSKFIYIDTDSKICSNRINKRSRLGENQISINYLEKCRQYHNEWLLSLKNLKNNVLLLDGNNEFETNTNILNNFVDKIITFIEKTN